MAQQCDMRRTCLAVLDFECGGDDKTRKEGSLEQLGKARTQIIPEILQKETQLYHHLGFSLMRRCWLTPELYNMNKLAPVKGGWTATATRTPAGRQGQGGDGDTSTMPVQPLFGSDNELSVTPTASEAVASCGY